MDGETYDVLVALSNIRAASAGCAAPTAVKIEDSVPDGWTPGTPSNGGKFSNT